MSVFSGGLSFGRSPFVCFSWVRGLSIGSGPTSAIGFSDSSVPNRKSIVFAWSKLANRAPPRSSTPRGEGVYTISLFGLNKA